MREPFFLEPSGFSRARAVFLVRGPFFLSPTRFSRARAVFLPQKASAHAHIAPSDVMIPSVET